MAGEMLWSTQSGYLTNNKLNMTFQKSAQPLMKFRQFVDMKQAFGKQQGQSVNWLKVANLSTYGGKLTETRTMHETPQVLSWGTVTVNEYGKFVAVLRSSSRKTLKPFRLITATVERIEQWATRLRNLNWLIWPESLMVRAL